MWLTPAPLLRPVLFAQPESPIALFPLTGRLEAQAQYRENTLPGKEADDVLPLQVIDQSSNGEQGPDQVVQRLEMVDNSTSSL